MSKKVLDRVPTTFKRPVDTTLDELTEGAAAQDQKATAPEGQGKDTKKEKKTNIRDKQTTLLLSAEVMRDLNDLACYYQAIGKTYTVTREDGEKKVTMERKITMNKLASDAITEYVAKHRDEIEKYRKRDF